MKQKSYIVRLLTFICRFIVIQNSVIKYITSIGQNTGMLKQLNSVHIIATIVDFIIEYQNLNSGNLLINGLNSSFDLVGSSGPSPSAIFARTKYDYRHSLSLTSPTSPSPPILQVLILTSFGKLNTFRSDHINSTCTSLHKYLIKRMKSLTNRRTTHHRSP